MKQCKIQLVGGPPIYVHVKHSVNTTLAMDHNNGIKSTTLGDEILLFVLLVTELAELAKEGQWQL